MQLCVSQSVLPVQNMSAALNEVEHSMLLERRSCRLFTVENRLLETNYFSLLFFRFVNLHYSANVLMKSLPNW